MLLNQNVTSRSAVTETCPSVWRVTAGGLQAVAELLQVDNDVAGNTTTHLYNVTMRRYACMTLTNLTFADAANPLGTETFTKRLENVYSKGLVMVQKYV